ncbi:helix-turn-helix domain-containing protein [Embleya sp. NBC_00896]|uniref:helix-turn-helix domain-containing protein n=1 Tax=Embleya sp. NBC_00896 TaxID=2975961 RepID=UPI002F906E03|nr:helix-turn-helix domain-containing protein [Embleya sp. NBC_00896]
MVEEHSGRSALAELRERLRDGRVLAGLSMTQLAARTGLGRTTVHAAFQADGPVPSADTVAALARALRLPAEELPALQRAAAQEAAPAAVPAAGPGRPIAKWDPHDLEVHPAGIAASSGSVVTGRVLSGYVHRAHDRVLADAVKDAEAGRNRMLVLVGSSSTGKTRACWEAVQPLANQAWRLWHPFDPTRAEAALADLARVAPRTVVWLNEAQHYLGDPQVGERIAAALHALLTDPGRGPVLILGTLWPEYEDLYTAVPRPGGPDPHSRARELLAGRTVTVPHAFNQDALDAAASLANAGDRLLAAALTRAGTDGRVAQDLAGAPELLRRYQHGTPAVRALLEAAMDARRLGLGLHLSQAFLTDAAADYLTDHDWDQLTDDWAEAAYADLARPVHGKQAPLGRTNPRPTRRPPVGPTSATAATPPTGSMFRLADYLEQHGRTARRLLCPPASFWHAAHTHLTHPGDLNNLAEAAKDRGRLQWAHHLRLRAARGGHTGAMVKLGWARELADDREGAESFYRQATDAGDPEAARFLGQMREGAGDREAAEALYQQAADAGEADALRGLARLREAVGDSEGAEAFYRQAADAGHTNAFTDLVFMRERAGDRQGAETYARQSADAGGAFPLTNLSVLREETGDRESAEALALEAVGAGDANALLGLGRMREEEGDREGAEAAYRQASDANGGPTIAHMARMREEAGDKESAEALALKAADAGDFYVLRDLARMREEAGDLEGVEALYRHAADAGHLPSLLGERWQYGLEPDGSPSSPWSADYS